VHLQELAEAQKHRLCRLSFLPSHAGNLTGKNNGFLGSVMALWGKKYATGRLFL
jgi:hypothetical protein